MFRFCWNTESRTSKDTTSTQTISEESVAKSQSLKRSNGGNDESEMSPPCVKRARQEGAGADDNARRRWNTRPDAQVLRDHIEEILGTEILTKHNEKRLIDQELAKCQIALEQLRRCHLIPFPAKSASPQQRVDVTNGSGAAVRNKPDEPASRWAPPFGVVDGPYAQHYARWLLPHSDFDGSDENWQFIHESARHSISEGRMTRNSAGEIPALPRGRPARGADIGVLGQAALNTRNEPKKKPGPCIIKRSDGQWVKLVCVTCNREDFSSTQGFINHCRIAHKNELKSHEEAAVKCGQLIDAPEAKGNATTGEDVSPQTPQSATVHPFARQDITEEEAYLALRSRIAASMELVRRGELSGIKKTQNPTTVHGKATALGNVGQPSSEAPHLSRLLHAHNFGGDLAGMLNDVKTSIPIDNENFDEESDDETSVSDVPLPRLPVVKRVPARSGQSPVPSSRPVSHKGFGIPTHEVQDATQTPEEDVVMDEPSLSPNTLISNNAPSLVSDDGEYDSDEGSSVSSQSEGSLEAESVSDVAEINLEDEHDSRVLRRTSTGIPSTVRLRSDDSKAVSFVSTIANNRNERRRRVT